MEKIRTISSIIPAVKMQEGAGVTIHRSIGTPALKNYDPFLLLDQFGSDNPKDYIAGFPSHPHRGFITLTYMLDGRMEHQDSMGNKGILSSGGIQWMKAASGVIHSEFPKQENGLMRGFQLWINLPAELKMSKPEYQGYQREKIPVYEGDEYKVKVISGQYRAVHGPLNDPNTKLLYLDIELQANIEVEVKLEETHNAFLYLYEGSLSIAEQRLNGLVFATFNEGSIINLKANEQSAKVIVVAGKRINEPIIQYGPFVMNSREEVMQAVDDYQAGKLVQ